MSTQIGQKVVLWRCEYTADAYADQFGIKHSAYVVLEEYEVEIIETKEVRGMFGSGKYEGWRAVHRETGKVFYCNWDSFPDDSSTPCWQWTGVPDGEGGYWFPVDALQHMGYTGGVVLRDGEQATPINSEKCELHNHWFRSDEECLLCKCRIHPKQEVLEQETINAT